MAELPLRIPSPAGLGLAQAPAALTASSLVISRDSLVLRRLSLYVLLDGIRSKKRDNKNS